MLGKVIGGSFMAVMMVLVGWKIRDNTGDLFWGDKVLGEKAKERERMSLVPVFLKSLYIYLRITWGCFKKIDKCWGSIQRCYGSVSMAWGPTKFKNQYC